MAGIPARVIISRLNEIAEMENIPPERLEINIAYAGIDQEFNERRSLAEFPIVRSSDGKLHLPPEQKAILAVTGYIEGETE